MATGKGEEGRERGGRPSGGVGAWPGASASSTPGDGGGWLGPWGSIEACAALGGGSYSALPGDNGSTAAVGSFRGSSAGALGPWRLATLGTGTGVSGAGMGIHWTKGYGLGGLGDGATRVGDGWG